MQQQQQYPVSLSLAACLFTLAIFELASASVKPIPYLDIQDKAVRRYRRLTEQVLAGREHEAPWDRLDDLRSTIADPSELSIAEGLLREAAASSTKADDDVAEASSLHVCGHAHLPYVAPEAVVTSTSGSYFDATSRRVVERSTTSQQHHRSTSRVFQSTSINGSANMRFYVIDEDVDVTGKTCKTAGESVSDMQGGDIVCTSDHILTAEKKAYLLDEVFPAATGILRDALRVRPVTSPITTTQAQCGFHVIPDEVRSPGISDTDFIIYLSTSPTSGSTVAWAGSCSYSSSDDNRPVSGRVNVSPAYLSPPTTGGVSRQTVMTIVHELLHALGFSGSAFGNANYGPPNEGSNPLTTETRRGETEIAVFIGEIARQKARDYFSCQTLSGAEFENDGDTGTAGSHWESRTHRDDVMCGVTSSQMYLSPLTLGALEGYGFYDPDYSKAETPFLGRGEGCGVHTDTCDVHHANFPTTSDYCVSPDYGCDTQSLGYGTCTSIYLGDGCNQYSRSVSCITSTSVDNTTGNRFGEDSRCFPVTPDVGETGYAPSTSRPVRCFTQKCDSETNVVSFKVGGYEEWIACPASYNFEAPHEISLASVTGGIYQGTVLCPDPSVICSTGILTSGGETSSPTPSTPQQDASASSAREPIEYPNGPAVAGFNFHLIGESLHELYLTGDAAESNRGQLAKAITLDVGRQIGEFTTGGVYSASTTLDDAIQSANSSDVLWRVYVRLLRKGSLTVQAYRKFGFGLPTYTEIFTLPTLYVSGIIFDDNSVSSFQLQSWETFLLSGTFNSTSYNTIATDANTTSWLQESSRLHSTLTTATSASAVVGASLGMTVAAVTTQGNVSISADLKLFESNLVSPSEGLVDTSFLADTQNSCGPGGCIVTVVGGLVGGFLLVVVVLLALFMCRTSPENTKVRRSMRKKNNNAKMADRNATGGLYDVSSRPAPIVVVSHEPISTNEDRPITVPPKPLPPSPSPTYEYTNNAAPADNGAWADDDYTRKESLRSMRKIRDPSTAPAVIPFGTVYFNN